METEEHGNSTDLYTLGRIFVSIDTSRQLVVMMPVRLTLLAKWEQLEACNTGNTKDMEGNSFLFRSVFRVGNLWNFQFVFLALGPSFQLNSAL